MANTDRLPNMEQMERLIEAIKADGGDPNDTSWGGATDEKIIELIAASDAGDIDLANDLGWSVGDVRWFKISSFMLSAMMGAAGIVQDHLLPLFLLDTDHYDLVSPTPGGRTKSAFVVGTENYVMPSLQVTGNGTVPARMPHFGYTDSVPSYNWSVCPIRNVINNDFRNALGEMKNIFKQFYVVSGKSDSVSETVRTADYFTFPSLKEMYGNNVPYRTSLFSQSGTSAYALSAFLVNVATEDNTHANKVISQAEYNATSQLKLFKDKGYSYYIPSATGTGGDAAHKLRPAPYTVVPNKEPKLQPDGTSGSIDFRSAFPGKHTNTSTGVSYSAFINSQYIGSASSTYYSLYHTPQGMVNVSPYIIGCI